MTWQDDPYEWIDPEKGRQGGVLVPGHPAPDLTLRERVVRRVIYYAGKHNVVQARNLLVSTAGVGSVRSVRDDQLSAVLKAFGG